MNKLRSNKILIGCLCAGGCEFIYGLSYMFTKQATDAASYLMLLSWRFVVAFAVINIFRLCGAVKINIRKKNIRPLIPVVVFNPLIYFVGETLGINYTTASESSSFLACIPISSLIASTIILHEKPARLQTLGICVTFAGVLTTVLCMGIEASLSVKGYLMLAVALVTFALYCVFVEKADEFTGAEITYAMLAAGAAGFTVAAAAESFTAGTVHEWIMMPITSKAFLSSVLYQGIIASIFAFFMNNVALTYIGVNRTSSFVGISTVVAILSGVLILDESFSVYQAAGVVLIIAGVYIANFRMNSD